MKMRIKNVLFGLSALGLLATQFLLPVYATTYVGGGTVHGHGGHGSYHGHGGYHDRGGIYFGGGWGGPNVIINVPAEGYYAPPLCHSVEVCDNYRGVCWLERRCE